MTLEEKLGNIPTRTGVYIMKGAKSEVIYVGKAKNLRNRVRSYFSEAGGDGRFFTKFLVERIADIDFVLTETEKEALILENNLIKQFKPRFNIYLRDDKTYVSIKIDLSRKFPRPEILRRRQKEKENALYFGPYASARMARETLKYINTIFPLRRCSETSFNNRTRPCVYHQMDQCLGPCSGSVDEKEYRETLDQVIMLLKGKNEDVITIMKEKMRTAAAELRFEEAAKTRDKVLAIENTIEQQKIDTSSLVDRDVFAYHKEGNETEIQAMFVRSGKLEDLTTYSFRDEYHTGDEVFSSFLSQFYSRTVFIPKEVLVPIEIEDSDLLGEWLSEMKGQKVAVIRPQKGEKARLVKMAGLNAEQSYRTKHSARESHLKLLRCLKENLDLKSVPQRIECFDISNTQGRHAVGSMVTFEDGVANKAKYRRFKIKTISQPDDFGMMREVLSRRFRRAVKENDLPDLAIIDGGKGQLGAALQVLRELEIENLDVIGLAKSKRKKGKSGEKERSDERVFIPGRSDPIALPQDSAELLLLERIRNEAHRFAIAYHQKLRQKEFKVSILEEIPGIGAARKKTLMKHFGDIRSIRSASVEELVVVENISEKQAREIYSFFHDSTVEPSLEAPAD